MLFIIFEFVRDNISFKMYGSLLSSANYKKSTSNWKSSSVRTVLVTREAFYYAFPVLLTWFLKESMPQRSSLDSDSQEDVPDFK